MKEDIKIVTLNFLLKFYGDEGFTNLLNSDADISSLLNSIVLQEFNNRYENVTFVMKGDFIDYSVGGDFQFIKSEILQKVFLQLSDEKLLQLVMVANEKLNKG